MIRVCSLFSGMGGFETGVFDVFGMENVDVVFSSEIDKKTKESYKIIYGEEPFGDVVEVNEKHVPDHDLLVAGFPCQAFSISGKRQGFADTRGTLFFEIARIAKEKQPKMMLLENVKGLINHDKGRTFETILEVLSSLGYVIDFKLLNSKHYNVPQHRERVYIVCSKNGKKEKWNINGSDSVSKIKSKLNEISEINSFNFQFPEENSFTPTLESILEENVDESYYLGKEKEEKIIKKIKEKGYGKIVYRIDDRRGGNSIHSWDLALRGEVTDQEKEALNQMILERRKGTKDGNPILPEQVGATKEMFDKLVKQGYLKHVNDKYDFKFGNLSFDISKVIHKESISPTVTCTDIEKYGVLVEDNAKLKFVTGTTDKPNWVENGKDISRNYKQGSRIYDSQGIASTLTARGVGGEGGHTGLYLTNNWRIRRLTPLEAIRLQGFPDSYYYELIENGITHRQIYKMAGNAVTTKVIKEIVHGMKETKLL